MDQQSQRKVENALKSPLFETRKFPAWCDTTWKNYISSFISPKIGNFIWLETRLNSLKFSRKHFSQTPIQNHSNFSSKSLFQTGQSKTGLQFQ